MNVFHAQIDPSIYSIKSVSTTYSVQNGDGVILCDTTSAGFTITLPNAIGNIGKTFILKNIGSNILTIATTSSQTIDGVTSLLIANANEYIGVISDNSNWRLIDDTRTLSLRYSSTVSTSITNSFTTIAFPTKEYDSYVSYNVVNGKFTAPIKGVYIFRWNAQTSSITNSTTQSFMSKVLVNSSTDIGECWASGTGGSSINYVLNGQTIAHLNANDTLELQLQNSNSTTLSGVANINWISITKGANF